MAIMLAVSAGLAMLLVWQQSRERQMSRCADEGGIWDGRRSSCQPTPPGIIIERDLKRT